MATIRRRNNKWQSIVRVVGYPQRTQSFTMKADAIAWSKQIELDIQRDLHNLKKIKYPTFKECLERYRDEIIVTKRSKEMESRLVKYILTEGFVNFPINKIDSSMLASYRDRALKSLKSSSVNRRLAIISHMFSIALKEWGYNLDNPVLHIRRPVNPEPRDRRFTKEELHKLLRGNRADPHMKFIIELALETAMRRSEIANIKPEHFTGTMLKIVKAKVKPRTIPLTKRAQQLLKDNLPIRKSANAILMMWKRLMKHYEIEDAHFHDLRHESICRLFTDKNLSVPEAQVISGHLEPRTLLKVYANIKAEDIVHKLGKDFDKAIAAEDKNLAALGQIKPNILQRGKMIDGVKKRLANSRAYGYDPKKEKPFKKKTKILLPVIPTPTLDLEILKPFPKDPRLEALGKKIFEDKRRSDQEKNKGLAGILGVDIKKI